MNGSEDSSVYKQSLTDVTTVLEACALAAGKILLEGWRKRDLTIDHKGTIDLVTQWDRASEDLLRSRLAESLPGVALVAEESGGLAAADDKPTLWIDPLDGTTNFVHGHAFFAVSIGLALGREVIASVVHAPALGHTWRATKHHGATRDGVQCRVSSVRALEDSLLATGFPYDNRTNPENNFAQFAALTMASQGVRRCGSAALDLCLTADGTFDGYWEHSLKPWDLAAGVLLVTESGGAVTALDGSPADFRTGAVIASNQTLHSSLVSALSSVKHH